MINFTDSLFEEYLTESKKMSDADCEKIIADALEKIQSIGPRFHRTDSLVKIDYKTLAADKCSGILHERLYVQDGQVKNSVTIYLNRRLFYFGLEPCIYNTIFHEYCHYLLSDEYIKLGKVRADGPDKFYYVSHEAYEEYGANGGHTRRWDTLVWQVNKIFKDTVLNGSVVAQYIPSEEVTLIDSICEEKPLMIISCRCGWADTAIYDEDLHSLQIRKQQRLDMLVRIVLKYQKLHCDACAGNIKVKYTSVEAEQKVKVLLYNYYTRLMEA